jgi:hypothetical protein
VLVDTLFGLSAGRRVDVHAVWMAELLPAPDQAERFNRTMADEWMYSQPFTSSQDRADALPSALHTYNHYRGHTALAGQPPITRINNDSGQYI